VPRDDDNDVISMSVKVDEASDIFSFNSGARLIMFTPL
jgi:hypothetical protein